MKKHMKYYIVILSSLYDFSTDLVAQRLEEAGAKYIRLNKEQFKDYDLHFNPVERTLKIKTDFFDGCIDRVRSVWFRQPVFLRNTSGKAISIDEQLSQSQWNAFLRGFMVYNDSYWMNFPQSTYAAESKPYQLMVASKLGFEVPETIISNGLGFEHMKNDEFVVKSIDTVFLTEDDHCYFAYTTKIDKDSLSLDITRSAPISFQEHIERKLDLRFTIIRDKLFSVAVTNMGSGIQGDWRLTNKATLKYNDFDCPPSLASRCFRYLKELGLEYGALDFALAHGKYYFIEINPTGEWGWLSTPERKIDVAIAEALIKGRNV
jgi:hypothetical protein